MLREKNIAFVFAHAGKETAPYIEDVTSDFIYCRMHGIGKTFKKGYPETEIQQWAERISLWSEGKSPLDAKCILKEKQNGSPRDAYVFYDNDEKQYAPANALTLINYLGLSNSNELEGSKIKKPARRKKVPSPRRKKVSKTQNKRSKTTSSRKKSKKRA